MAGFQELQYQTFVTPLGKCFSSYNLSIRKTFFDNFSLNSLNSGREREVSKPWNLQFRIWRSKFSKCSQPFLKVSLKSMYMAQFLCSSKCRWPWKCESEQILLCWLGKGKLYSFKKRPLCDEQNFCVWCIKIHPHIFACVLSEGLYIFYTVQN